MNKRLNHLSLNQRLTIAVMSFIISIFALFQLITHHYYLKIEEEKMLSRTQVLANGIVKNLAAPMLFDDQVISNEVLSSIKANPLIVQARLEYPDNRVFTQYTNNNQAFIPLSSKETEQLEQQGYVFSTELLHVITPVELKEETIGHMHISVSLQALKELRRDHYKLTLLLLLGLLMLSTVFINQILTRLIQPLSQHADRQQKTADNIFDYSQDAILIIDNEGCVTMANPATSHITGFHRDEIIGQHFKQLLATTEYDQEDGLIQQTLEKANHWQGEMSFRHKSGSMLPLFIRVNHIQDSSSQKLQTVIIASDLRSMKQMEHFEHLATHDALTHLPNRSKLEVELKQHLEKQRHSQDVFAVLFIDLDDFKAVNDNYGHETGDKALQIIAERLKRTIRDKDLVARLAGDEFIAIINPVNSQEDNRHTCERMLSRIMEPINLGSIKLNLSASIGCYYVFADEKQNADEVIQQADEAMYDAKLAGKGQMREFNQFR